MAVAPDYNTLLQQSTQQATQAIQPAIQSLEASKQPLTQRYEGLINQLKEQQGQEESRTKTSTSREFGRRGIPLSSGVFDTTLNEYLQPIGREYAGRVQQTGYEQQNALADLASRIAGLQSGAQQSGIQNALSLYGQQYGAYTSEIENEKQRQFAAQQAELDRQNQARTAASARTAATPTFSAPAQPRTDYASVAANVLRSQGNKDVYVDKNEALSAVKTLISQGIPAAQAEALVEQAFAGGYLKKYKW